jgi:hypothetical protein
VLRHRFSWKRLSMAGALAYRPDRSQAALVFQIKRLQHRLLIEFLTDLHDRSEDHPSLIWMSALSHRSAAMKGLDPPTLWLIVEPAARLCPAINPINRSPSSVKANELSTSARTPRTKPHPHSPPTPDCNASATATTCALPSSELHTGLSL